MSENKQEQKTPRSIQLSLYKRLNIFAKDPFNPVLNNHLLGGTLKGFRSINITGDWRALYIEKTFDDAGLVITFHLLGTHSELYG